MPRVAKQACGGSVLIWGCCSWSVLSSASSSDYLNIQNDQVFLSRDFVFSAGKMTMLRFSVSELRKSSFKKHESSFSHIGWSDLNPTENLCDVLEKTWFGLCKLSLVPSLGPLRWSNTILQVLTQFSFHFYATVGLRAQMPNRSEPVNASPVIT